MIADLKPYPAYKDSGVPSLGQVPEHWNVTRLKTVCSRSALYGANIAANFYTSTGARFLRTTDITEDGGVRAGGVFLPDDTVKEYLLSDGDILISRSGTIGRSFRYRARQHGICAYAGYLVRFVPAADADPDYVFFFTKTPSFADFIKITAISSTIENVNGEKYANMQLPIPPRHEQSSIVRFLDHSDRRIRRYIAAKRKLIALLNEQKQAIIDHAVTRGVDPNVRLKPSGVEWLGDVPEHWEVSRLKRHWQVTDCKHVTVPFVDDGLPLASVREVQRFDLDLSAANRTTEEWYSFLANGQRAPTRGDLIYCRNVSVGACSYVDTNEKFAMGQDVCMIRSKTENGRFLNYFMHSTAMQRQLSLILIGSTFNRINVSEIKSLVVPVPPRREQDLIATQLDTQIGVFDAPIRIAEREMALLREYRTRLIADVVTGKLDVREMGAKLPDEADEPGPLDEIEEPAEGADIADQTELEGEAEPAAA